MYHLNNQLAVVTGVSHGMGIGAAICRKLAESGCNIFFTYFQAEETWVKQFQQEIIDKGVLCGCCEVDLSEDNIAANLLDTICDLITFPNILINNAAYSTRDGYKKLDASQLDDHYKVNMRATLLLSVEFSRRFERMDLKSGRIINLTSGQDRGPMIEELAYGATKAAISAFTLSLSAEVAHLGITVNAVNPGPTDTGWMTNDIKGELRPKFLRGRIGIPEDAAKLIAFLASKEADWITGQVIHSEGSFLRK